MDHLFQRESVGCQVQTVDAIGFVAHAFMVFLLSSEQNRDLSSKHRPCLKSGSREMSGTLAARSQTRGTHDPSLLGRPHFRSGQKNPSLHLCSGGQRWSSQREGLRRLWSTLDTATIPLSSTTDCSGGVWDPKRQKRKKKKKQKTCGNLMFSTPLPSRLGCWVSCPELG